MSDIVWTQNKLKLFNNNNKILNNKNQMTAGEIRSKQEWGEHAHPCIATLHVWVVLIVPGCVHICLHFAVGIGSSGVKCFNIDVRIYSTLLILAFLSFDIDVYMHL